MEHYSLKGQVCYYQEHLGHIPSVAMHKEYSVAGPDPPWPDLKSYGQRYQYKSLMIFNIIRSHHYKVFSIHTQDWSEKIIISDEQEMLTLSRIADYWSASGEYPDPQLSRPSLENGSGPVGMPLTEGVAR